MRFLAWVAVVGLFALAGCQKHAAPVVAGTALTASEPGLGGAPNAAVDPAQPATGQPTRAAGAAAPGKGNEPASIGALGKILKQTPPPIEKPGSGGWSKAAMTPLALAKSMDSAFYHLDGGVADIRIHYILPIGEGTCNGSAKIKNGKTFSVKYPIIEGDPPHPQVIESRGNAGKYVFFHPTVTKTDKDAFSAVRPFRAGGSEDGQSVLARWELEMPSLSMSHFISGKDVYGPLVGALTATGSGYGVTCEVRTVNYQGHNIKNYRIVATRKAGAKVDEIEIVVDANKFVPVTMRTRKSAPGQKSTIVEWAGTWKGGKFSAMDFELPAS